MILDYTIDRLGVTYGRGHMVRDLSKQNHFLNRLMGGRIATKVFTNSSVKDNPDTITTTTGLTISEEENKKDIGISLDHTSITQPKPQTGTLDTGVTVEGSVADNKPEQSLESRQDNIQVKRKPVEGLISKEIFSTSKNNTVQFVDIPILLNKNRYTLVSEQHITLAKVYTVNATNQEGDSITNANALYPDYISEGYRVNLFNSTRHPTDQQNWPTGILYSNMESTANWTSLYINSKATIIKNLYHNFVKTELSGVTKFLTSNNLPESNTSYLTSLGNCLLAHHFNNKIDGVLLQHSSIDYTVPITVKQLPDSTDERSKMLTVDTQQNLTVYAIGTGAKAAVLTAIFLSYRTDPVYYTNSNRNINLTNLFYSDRRFKTVEIITNNLTMVNDLLKQYVNKDPFLQYQNLLDVADFFATRYGHEQITQILTENIYAHFTNNLLFEQRTRHLQSTVPINFGVVVIDKTKQFQGEWISSIYSTSNISMLLDKTINWISQIGLTVYEELNSTLSLGSISNFSLIKLKLDQTRSTINNSLRNSIYVKNSFIMVTGDSVSGTVLPLVNYEIRNWLNKTQIVKEQGFKNLLLQFREFKPSIYNYVRVTGGKFIKNTLSEFLNAQTIFRPEIKNGDIYIKNRTPLQFIHMIALYNGVERTYQLSNLPFLLTGNSTQEELFPLMHNFENYVNHNGRIKVNYVNTSIMGTNILSYTALTESQIKSESSVEIVDLNVEEYTVTDLGDETNVEGVGDSNMEDEKGIEISEDDEIDVNQVLTRISQTQNPLNEESIVIPLVKKSNISTKTPFISEIYNSNVYSMQTVLERSANRDNRNNPKFQDLLLGIKNNKLVGIPQTNNQYLMVKLNDMGIRQLQIQDYVRPRAEKYIILEEIKLKLDQEIDRRSITSITKEQLDELIVKTSNGNPELIKVRSTANELVTYNYMRLDNLGLDYSQCLKHLSNYHSGSYILLFTKLDIAMLDFTGYQQDNAKQLIRELVNIVGELKNLIYVAIPVNYFEHIDNITIPKTIIFFIDKTTSVT